jgi:transcriptional regulator with XRE-family HTH domain
MDNPTPKILTELRERKGWSKTTVAKKLNIKTVSTYANWEYGTREPDKDMLAKIAELYNVTTDYLITGKEDPIKKQAEQAYNDPDFQYAMRSLNGMDQESKEEVLNFIEYVMQKQKGRKPGQRQPRNGQGNQEG